MLLEFLFTDAAVFVVVEVFLHLAGCFLVVELAVAVFIQALELVLRLWRGAGAHGRLEVLLELVQADLAVAVGVVGLDELVVGLFVIQLAVAVFVQAFEFVLCLRRGAWAWAGLGLPVGLELVLTDAAIFVVVKIRLQRVFDFVAIELAVAVFVQLLEGVFRCGRLAAFVARAGPGLKGLHLAGSKRRVGLLSAHVHIAGNGTDSKCKGQRAKTRQQVCPGHESLLVLNLGESVCLGPHRKGGGAVGDDAVVANMHFKVAVGGQTDRHFAFQHGHARANPAHDRAAQHLQLHARYRRKLIHFVFKGQVAFRQHGHLP